MSRTEILNEIIDGGIVAILRLDNADKVIPVSKSIYNGGIRAIEVTMNTP